MKANLKAISATRHGHSSVPRPGSSLPGSARCHCGSSAFYARVIVALLLFTSAGLTIAQNIDTGMATQAKVAETFSNAPTGMDIINGYAWIVSYSGGTGNDFVLTAVPEPGTWVAGSLALAGLVCYQRRRFARFFKRGP
jgi:hypothetical protein